MDRRRPNLPRMGHSGSDGEVACPLDGEVLLRHRFPISADQTLSLSCPYLFAEEIAILNPFKPPFALIDASAATSQIYDGRSAKGG